MATEIEKHITRGHGATDQWRHSGGARSRPLVRSGGRSRSGRSRTPKRPDGSYDTSQHTSTAEARRTHRGSADSPISVKSAKEALDLMEQGKHVIMDPDTVGVLLDKLAEIGQKAFEAEKAGKKFNAPNYNLCLIHVPDTNIFCEKNKGIPRIKMPQVKGKNIRPGSKAAKLLAKQNEENGTPDNLEVDATAEFVAFLKSGGVTITKGQTVDADKLKATQSELVGSKVGGMIGAHKAGKYDPSKDAIFVSEDNYVLDGHHRWAATVGAKYVEGENLTMTVDRINMPIQELVDLTNKFLEGFGILPNAASATSKSAPRELPCIGCGEESSLDDSFRHRDLLAKNWPARTRLAGWSSDTQTDSTQASTGVGQTSAGRGHGHAARAGTANSGSTARSGTSTGSLSKRQRGQKSSTVATTRRAATQPTSRSGRTQPTWPTTVARDEHATTRLTESGTSASTNGSSQASTPTISPVSSASATAPASTVSSAGSVVGKRSYDIPSPKSTPKEVAGSHNHKPAGTSILWPALYRELRKKGYSKAKAAAISNGQWNRKHGAKTKNATSTRFTKSATALADGVSDVLSLRTNEQVGRLDAGSVVTGVADNGTIGDGSIVVLPHDSVPTPQRLGRRVPHAGVPAPGKAPLPDEASILGVYGPGQQLVDGADPDHHLHPSGSGSTPGDGGGSRLSGEFRHAAMLQAGNKRHGKGASNLNNTRVTKSDEIAGEISKTDDDKQLVYGWMYVTHNRDGEVVIDKSGDFIDDVTELDDAVVDFVLHARTGGVDHERDGDGPRQASRLVESIVFTPEKLTALGLQPGDLPTGWWAGWKVDDPEVWAGVKSGKYKSFSIHGSGVREPVAADIGKADPTNKDRRRMAAAYTGQQVRGARSGTLSSKERKQRIDAARASAAKRKGSGTKDKNPKTPETVARERTRIRRETPGTAEHNEAMDRMQKAIASGKPLKVREGELDLVIERAKARGLKYEHEGNTVTIHLSDGRKLMVQTTKKKSEED